MAASLYHMAQHITQHHMAASLLIHGTYYIYIYVLHLRDFGFMCTSLIFNSSGFFEAQKYMQASVSKVLGLQKFLSSGNNSLCPEKKKKKMVPSSGGSEKFLGSG